MTTEDPLPCQQDLFDLVSLCTTEILVMADATLAKSVLDDLQVEDPPQVLPLKEVENQ